MDTTKYTVITSQMRDKEAQLIWEAYEEAPVEDRPTKCKRCGGTGKKNSTTSQRLAGWPANTQCKQCNGTGDSSKGTGDGWGPYKNKLKEDHHPDSDEHAKQVQWTKDVKAKLAKAQEIGDSKEANKLQRFLDMHGIDEAGDPATQQPKRRRADDPDWRKRGSIKKKLDKRSDQLARDRRRRSVQGAPKWYKDQKEY